MQTMMRTANGRNKREKEEIQTVPSLKEATQCKKKTAPTEHTNSFTHDIKHRTHLQVTNLT